MDSLLVILPLFCVLVSSDAAIEGDEVKHLPGLNPQPMFRHYSGYLTATNNRYLHYWFVESQNAPSTDPVLVWMNGGPGCSSMEGILKENGPFSLQTDGITLQYNKYSWNKVANVLYIETPAGVGYSYSEDRDYKTNDDQVSKDNYFAIMNFFAKFPEFRKNPFFLSGESYAGVYVPTLSLRVIDNPWINFQGFAIGNGVSDPNLNTNSGMYFGYYHGLLSIKMWNAMVSSCCKGEEEICDFAGNTDPCCQSKVQEAESLYHLPGINVYNLYDTCYVPKASGIESEGLVVFDLLPFLFSNTSAKEELQKHLRTVPKERLRVETPCLNVTSITSYMNHPEVKEALHIAPNLPEWEDCSGVVAAEYGTIYKTMAEQYKKILAADKRVLVYNGDVDMVCNFLGDEWFVDSLRVETVEPRKAWYINDDMTGTKQIAGFVRQMKNLVFTTIKGAGHMAPKDKPQEAFEMMKRFLSGTPY